MPNFTCQLPVEEAYLDFRFSLIHYPGGTRYFITVTRQDSYVTSFYFAKNDQDTWKLFDRYKTVPAWIYELEPLLAAAINSHNEAARI